MVVNFFKKIRNIADAFSNPLPLEEGWYKERLEQCGPCEFNSENVKQEDKSWIHTIRDVANPCPEKRHCTVCGCCIDRKAAVPAESCGLKGSLKHTQAGYKPKWDTLVVKDNVNNEIYAIKPEGQNYKLRREGNTFVLDLGTTKENKLSFKFEIATPEDHMLKNFVAGCGCTFVQVESLGKGKFIFPIELSTKTFIKNTVNSKFISIYFLENNVQKTVNIKINVILQ